MGAEALDLGQMKPIAQAVEVYLDEISYKAPLGYVPSTFALAFVNFIKLVNGAEGEENKTPLMHYWMLDTLVSGNSRIANMCCRGAGKTAIFGEYFILYLAVYGVLPKFGEVSLMLYVSDSIENGVKNMRKNLEHRWENSDFLQKYIPRIKLTDIRWEFENLAKKKLIVKGYGATTGVRGAKEMGTRPQIAILDDLVSDEDARSDTIMQTIEATIYKAVNFALHPKKNLMVWSGTPFNSKDPLYKAVESGVWAVNVFPVCETFPCSEEDFVSVWPDRFDYAYVKKQYDDALALGNISTFNQELMLRIMSDEDRLIPAECILWYSHTSLLKNKNKFNYYITTDFATSEKESSDYSVISVWAYNNQGDWFWVDGICKRQTMDKNIDDLFTLAQKWSPDSVGVEISGQQLAFISWIQSEMMERNIWFNLASDKNSGEPGIRPNTNKMKRFNLVVPIIKARKFYLPSELKDSVPIQECLAELSLVSVGGMKSKHDDFLDTISMLATLKPWKPSEESGIKKAANSKYWDFDDDDDGVSSLESYIV